MNFYSIDDDKFTLQLASPPFLWHDKIKRVANLIIQNNLKKEDYQEKHKRRMQRKYDYVFKIVIIGSSSVGKSSILKRFADDQFQDSYISTIGIDFRFKSVVIGDSYVKLQIWDTAGQERFRGITKSYYKGAQAIILVYDISNPKSFEDVIDFWLNQCKINSEHANAYIFVNKCDKMEAQINSEQLKILEQKKVQFFKVSAKTGMNVNQSIIQIAKQLMEIHPKISEDKLNASLKQSSIGRGKIESKCCNRG